MRPSAHPSNVPEPHEGILTATRGEHAPPEMRPGSGRPQRLYVVALLCACLLLVGAVAAFNAFVDPYASFGKGQTSLAIWNDRDVKVRLVDGLTAPPETIVLGSSRALKVEPSYITRLSGRPAFNAAVSGGKPVDAYVFIRLLHDRFPQTHPTYLWLLDQESFAPEPIDPILVNNDRLSRYLPQQERVEARLTDLSWLLSWRTLLTSWRTWQHTRAERRQALDRQQQEAQKGTRPAAPKAEFLPDGFRVSDAHDRRAARGVPLAEGIAASTKVFSDRYRNHFPGLSRMQKTWFERTLSQLNRSGSTPVLVLSPVHPRLLSVLRPLGWNRRHEQVLEYLAGLRGRYRFVLLDMSEIASFDGSPRLFFDGVHMKVGNYRRLLRTVFADGDAATSLEGSR